MNGERESQESNEYIKAINKRPLIKSYINYPLRNLNRDLWENAVNRYSNQVEGLIIKDYEYDWKRRLLTPSFHWIKELNLLNSELSQEQQEKAVELIFKFGYEMADFETATVLTPLIQHNLIENDVFDPQLLNLQTTERQIGFGVNGIIAHAILSKRTTLLLNPPNTSFSEEIIKSLSDIDFDVLGSKE